MKPTVLRLITRLNIGGPAIQALLLTRELMDEFPTVLATGTPTPEEGELSDPAVPIRRVSLVRQPHPIQDLAAYRSIGRLLDRERPSLVHTHMAKAGALGRWAAARHGSKPITVHTFHGHVFDGYFSPPVRRVILSAERGLARRTDALIAVSKEVRDELLDLGIGGPEKVRVIPLGFDLSDFLAIDTRDGGIRAEFHLDSEVPLLAVIGRLAPIKDHKTLLRAMALLPEAHLLVVGDGELSGELRDFCIGLGISDRVHFVGWRSDIPEVLADVDVVLLTSRSEGTPVSLIEAAAAGRPVVATDVGGVRSIVVPGKTGLLVPPERPQAVADAVRKVLTSGGRRMGTEGREFVRDRFDKRRLLADMTELYRELLAHRSALGRS